MVDAHRITLGQRSAFASLFISDYNKTMSFVNRTQKFHSFLLPSSLNSTPITNRSALFEELMQKFAFNFGLIHNHTNNTVTSDVEQAVNVVSQTHLCGAHAPWSNSWEPTTLITSGLSIAGFIAVLNACVIFTFIVCDDVRRTPQNLYILNLAVCDFCVGINSLPGLTLYFYNMCWPYGVISCQIMAGMDWITSVETGISLCLIAYDRLQLVRLGALYDEHETRGVVVRRILLSWVSVIILMCPGFLIPVFSGVSVNASGECVNEIYQIEILGTTVATVTGIVPPLVLAVIYYRVHLRMRARRRSLGHSTASSVEREARRQRRMTRGMKLLAAVFFGSWIPPTLFDLATYSVKNIPQLEPLRLDEANHIALQLVIFFKFWIYLNSLVNPFLYAFAFRAIRGGMEKTFLPNKYRKALQQRRKLKNRRRSSAKRPEKPSHSSLSVSVQIKPTFVVGQKLLKAIGSDESSRIASEKSRGKPSSAGVRTMLLQAPRIKLRASLTSTTVTVPKGNTVKNPDSAPPSSSESRSSIVINLAAINYNTIVMPTATTGF